MTHLLPLWLWFETVRLFDLDTHTPTPPTALHLLMLPCPSSPLCVGGTWFCAQPSTPNPQSPPVPFCPLPATTLCCHNYPTPLPRVPVCLGNRFFFFSSPPACLPSLPSYPTFPCHLPHPPPATMPATTTLFYPRVGCLFLEIGEWNSFVDAWWWNRDRTGH